MNYNKIVYSSKVKSINNNYYDYYYDINASKISMSSLNERER